ncbi:3-hydroxyacyl-CoA dehydrogenase family protein (plasmid) [Agrobacterium leguminum]|uniref:3-hydroxyacyl-CoA dehydrogenase family protein n=1 Tax=Agrobacterium leguminum TaxID=2792015 RepID=UPI00272959BD|nr:3-hydroxyacyl-CoA dehydrogenase family protein [Agrobacterium leguminum]WLE00673.1 3-hydroxyacyl-CoA dehydrogenase family protein [Agrobacterium leguminum]
MAQLLDGSTKRSTRSDSADQVPEINTNVVKLRADGVTDYQTIDRTWMVAGQSSFVPFAVVDLGGIALVQTIMLNMARAQGDALLEKAANRLKTDYVDKGKLGRASGEGFYSYPNPAFLDEGFLKAV